MFAYNMTKLYYILFSENLSIKEYSTILIYQSTNIADNCGYNMIDKNHLYLVFILLWPSKLFQLFIDFRLFRVLVLCVSIEGYCVYTSIRHQKKSSS